MAEPKYTGCTRPRPTWAASGAAEAAVGHRGLVVDGRGQQVVVVVGEQLGQPGREPGVGGAIGREPGVAGAEPLDRPHRHDRRGELGGDGSHGAGVLGADAVDLVHEQQGGDAEAPQGPQQQAGLGLHALDGRDHQHGPVEHAQHPLHLGDEVGVAGGVDQVDGDVADHERHHGGLDGDAALAFQGQGVGLGAAVVDAADLVDDPGGEQQPLGEGGLTGVDVGQDPQVARVHGASCPRDRCAGWTWTLPSSRLPSPVGSACRGDQHSRRPGPGATDLRCRRQRRCWPNQSSTLA